MARMTEKIKLPSNGYLYDGTIPAELTIQNLTSDEESILYGSSGDHIIEDIVRSIVKEKIDVNRLTVFDRHFILMKGRILTYGPMYPIEVKCDCGNSFQYDVDLNELPVYSLDSDLENGWDIPELPQCKKVVTLHIPDGVDTIEMDRVVKRRVAKYGLVEGRERYKSNIAVNILKIDGEEVSPEVALQFVSELSGMDNSFLKKEINKLEVGYETLLTVPCPKCGKDVSLRLPMTADFFRTEFRD